MSVPSRPLPRLHIALGLLAAILPAALAQAAPPPAAAPSARPSAAAKALPASDASAIVAIVDGDVITMGDVDNRRRLFALSTGMGTSSDVLARLTGQVVDQLIDEHVKLREMQRRQIAVGEKDIANAIREIEGRNGMAEGMLRKRLASDGVSLSTMIDQVRVQLGWGQVLREALGPLANVSDADIAQRIAALKAQIGQTEYRVSEIFVAYANPSRTEEARGFADTVIQQLRAGAPFQIVAAQFSQSQTALQGGDLGWVQGFELDPAVLRVVQQMPEGAISNPIPVPGGLSIVTVHGQRQIGKEQATMLSLRQVFFKFPTVLVQAQPTEAQRKEIEAAQHLAATAKDCDAMEAAAKASGDEKAGNPGEVRLETVQVPALRQLMATQPVGKPTQPLIANDGAAVLMVCSREVKTLELPSRKELSDRILAERVELTSRQLARDLLRRAVIDRRI
jgi:peptidyl-prolyl cis-trans isomerase SurA